MNEISFRNYKTEYHIELLNKIKGVYHIKPGDKVYIENNELLTHTSSYLRGIIRWWYKYSRRDCIEYLINLYTEMHNLVRSLSTMCRDCTYNKKNKTHARKRVIYLDLLEYIKELKIKILDSKIGVVNLMKTYMNDDAFIHEMNGIIDIIDTIHTMRSPHSNTNTNINTNKFE